MKKAMTGLSLFAAAFGLAAFSAPASADCTTDTDSQWECLEIESAPGTYVDRTDMGLQGAVGDKGDPGVVPFTFEGDASLYHWYTGTLACTLTATGYAEVDSKNNEAAIEVTSLSSGGGGSCGSVGFGNLPLTVTVDGDNHGDVYDKHGYESSKPHSHNAFGLLGDSGTLQVLYNGIPVCNDKVELEFGNDVNGVNKNDPSFFRFNDTLSGWLGSCTVSGTLLAKTVYKDGKWVSGDVNAW